MRQKILTMLDMQEAMNEKVHSDWQAQNFEWYRAIWVEAAELLDHYGWKWWKKQSPDREQVVLELIDIWHFGLSLLLSGDQDKENIARQVEADLARTKKATSAEAFRLLLEDFALQTLQTRQFDVPGFASLMLAMDLEFDALYRSYVGKNVLNFFRQDNGYKEGSYIKVWAAKEDNEHLVEILDELDDSRIDFRDAVYQALAKRYSEVSG